MATGLLLALILIAWGAQAVVPARLARADEPSRLFWARAALPLALAGAMLAVLVLGSNPDAALVSGLAPFWGRIPGRLILLSLAALLLAEIEGAPRPPFEPAPPELIARRSTAPPSP